jgi:hypothetical protein
MQGIMNHCGAVELTLDELRQVPTPEPLTPTHYPIRHHLLVDTVLDSLNGSGYEVESQTFSYHAERKNMFGLLALKAEGNDEWRRMVALRDSGTKMFSSALGIGSQVFVCDNLCFSATVVVGRKHTLNIERDLPLLVGKATGLLSAEWADTEKRFEVFKASELSPQSVHDVLCKGLRQGALPASKIKSVLTEWDAYGRGEYSDGVHTPEQFAPRTANSLLNAFTETAKAWPFDTMTNRTQRFTGILDQHVGFEASALTIDVDGIDDAEVSRN